MKNLRYAAAAALALGVTAAGTSVTPAHAVRPVMPSTDILAVSGRPGN